jgi:hypothetical protein
MKVGEVLDVGEVSGLDTYNLTDSNSKLFNERKPTRHSQMYNKFFVQVWVEPLEFCVFFWPNFVAFDTVGNMNFSTNKSM